MLILVTAGPTYEYWDAIRYLTNRSSGKMGYAIAAAAKAAGHEVILISGPTALKAPKGVRFISVISAEEMYRAVKKSALKAQVVVMAAAVSDFRPAVRKWSKIKKLETTNPTLRLRKNPDILLSLGRRKGNRILIGFALEVQHGLQNAKEKLRRKNLDYIVLNNPGVLESDKASVCVFGRDGSSLAWRGLTKAQIGKRLIRLAEKAL